MKDLLLQVREMMREQVEEAVFGAMEKFYKQRDEERPMPSEDSDNLLDRLEVCERYHISKGTLNNWVHRGLIKPMKLGRRVLFPMQEILRAESDGLTKFKR